MASLIESAIWKVEEMVGREREHGFEVMRLGYLGSS